MDEAKRTVLPGRAIVPFVQRARSDKLPQQRVVQFESAAQTCRCTPAKAKYCTETDSEQVVRTKDEKYFEKRVNKPLTSLGDKGMRSIASATVCDICWCCSAVHIFGCGRGALLWQRVADRREVGHAGFPACPEPKERISLEGCPPGFWQVRRGRTLPLS